MAGEVETKKNSCKECGSKPAKYSRIRLCRTCYDRRWRERNPKKYREHNRDKYKKVREKYRKQRRERTRGIVHQKLANLCEEKGLTPPKMLDELTDIFLENFNTKNRLNYLKIILYYYLSLQCKTYVSPKQLDLRFGSVSLSDKMKIKRLVSESFGKRFCAIAQRIQHRIHEISQGLNISPTVQKRAAKLLEQAEEGGMVLTGKSASGLASAALYLAARELGEPRSQFEISQTSAISEVTLRNRAKQIKKHTTSIPMKRYLHIFLPQKEEITGENDGEE